MAGLLAARVLSEFYENVTLVERDRLPDVPAQRRGVPQGRHVHGLFCGGSQELGRLFPGLLDELVAAGANVADDGDLSRVSIRSGGHELDRSGKFADPTSELVYLASRPLLEGVNLLRGMNYRSGSRPSVILMIDRPGAPYDDRIDEDGRVPIYEGRDRQSAAGCVACGA